MIENQNFAQAIEAADQGKGIARPTWKGSYAYMQPKTVMTKAQKEELPEYAKNDISNRTTDIIIGKGLYILDTENRLNAWVATNADILATDWIILG